MYNIFTLLSININNPSKNFIYILNIIIFLSIILLLCLNHFFRKFLVNATYTINLMLHFYIVSYWALLLSYHLLVEKGIELFYGIEISIYIRLILMMLIVIWFFIHYLFYLICIYVLKYDYTQQTIILWKIRLSVKFYTMNICLYQIGTSLIVISSSFYSIIFGFLLQIFVIFSLLWFYDYNGEELPVQISFSMYLYKYLSFFFFFILIICLLILIYKNYEININFIFEFIVKNIFYIEQGYLYKILKERYFYNFIIILSLFLIFDLFIILKILQNKEYRYLLFHKFLIYISIIFLVFLIVFMLRKYL